MKRRFRAPQSEILLPLIRTAVRDLLLITFCINSVFTHFRFILQFKSASVCSAVLTRFSIRLQDRRHCYCVTSRWSHYLCQALSLRCTCCHSSTKMIVFLSAPRDLKCAFVFVCLCALGKRQCLYLYTGVPYLNLFLLLHYTQPHFPVLLSCPKSVYSAESL